MMNFKFKTLIKNTPSFLVLSLAICAPAYASDVGTISKALEGLLGIMTGTAAQTVATIAIAATGWAWMTSQISLKTATVIGLGIGIVFGAPEIAKILGASGASA